MTLIVESFRINPDITHIDLISDLPLFSATICCHL